MAGRNAVPLLLVPRLERYRGTPQGVTRSGSGDARIRSGTNAGAVGIGLRDGGRRSARCGRSRWNVAGKRRGRCEILALGPRRGHPAHLVEFVRGLQGCPGPRVAVFGGSPAARSCGRPWCSRMCLNPCAGASVWAFPAPRAISPLGLWRPSPRLWRRFSTSRCCRRPRHVAPCRRCRRGLALAFCDRPAGTQILALGLLPVERLDAGCGGVEVSASFVI